MSLKFGAGVNQVSVVSFVEGALIGSICKSFELLKPSQASKGLESYNMVVHRPFHPLTNRMAFGSA